MKKPFLSLLAAGAVAAFCVGVIKELSIIRKATTDPDGYDLPKSDDEEETKEPESEEEVKEDN